MACFQRDHDVRVGCSGHAAVAIAQVDARDRQANIVDDALEFPRRDSTANRVLDMINQDRSLFDPCPGMRAHVQSKDPGINARKEIPSQEGDQTQRGYAKAQEERGEKQAPAQNQAEQMVVTLAETLEGLFERLLQTYQR